MFQHRRNRLWVIVSGNIGNRDNAYQPTVGSYDGHASDTQVTHPLYDSGEVIMLRTVLNRTRHYVTYTAGWTTTTRNGSNDDVAISDRANQLATFDDRQKAEIAVGHHLGNSFNLIVATDGLRITAHDFRYMHIKSPTRRLLNRLSMLSGVA